MPIMRALNRLLSIRTRDLLVPTVTVLTIRLICVFILTVCMITTNLSPVQVVMDTTTTPTPINANTGSHTGPALVADKSDWIITCNGTDRRIASGTGSLTYNLTTGFVMYDNRTALSAKDIKVIGDCGVNYNPTDGPYSKVIGNWTVSYGHGLIISKAEGIVNISGVTVHPFPTPPVTPDTDYCLSFGKYFLMSYLFVWIVCILVETLIIGYTLSGNEINSVLELLIQIKIGSFVVEVLLLITNTALIGDYIGFTQTDENLCMNLIIMKAVVDITIFNWIIFVTIMSFKECYYRNNTSLHYRLGSLSGTIGYGQGFVISNTSGIVTVSGVTVHPIPTPPVPPDTDHCLSFGKYFLMSYLFVWIVCILVETLIIGYTLSGNEINSVLDPKANEHGVMHKKCS
ncbi:unnamed protein product [Oppiella nova]|uniref:Uncharacterized protein n=1 Tax=Oppiella nova TaxID=334625 RepID=A0A7R9LP04_9ACAR|nr:unnamed protein product [Oppiella nova]CAG2165555.1 unnamed protein product [Oppiella nova]